VNRRLLLALAAVIVLSGYVVEGIGYHRVSKACWESHHRDDGEGEVYGGGIGLAFDVALWPVYLAADGLNGRDCG
jgi:hypothetical protein